MGCRDGRYGVNCRGIPGILAINTPWACDAMICRFITIHTFAFLQYDHGLHFHTFFAASLFSAVLLSRLDRLVEPSLGELDSGLVTEYVS